MNLQINFSSTYRIIKLKIKWKPCKKRKRRKRIHPSAYKKNKYRDWFFHGYDGIRGSSSFKPANKSMNEKIKKQI
jgi:hypothetical protein